MKSWKWRTHDGLDCLLEIELDFLNSSRFPRYSTIPSISTHPSRCAILVKFKNPHYLDVGHICFPSPCLSFVFFFVLVGLIVLVSWLRLLRWSFFPMALVLKFGLSITQLAVYLDSILVNHSFFSPFILSYTWSSKYAVATKAEVAGHRFTIRSSDQCHSGL